MSGNTGKMTKAAIRERGPRLVLARILKSLPGLWTVGELVIYRHGHHPPTEYSIIAQSYSVSYLKKIMAVNDPMCKSRQEGGREK